MNAIDEDWREKCSIGPIHRKLTLTDAGLMLGRETILIRPAHGATAAEGVSVDCDETCVLALVAAAYGRPVADHTIAKMRRATELGQEGEKALAQFSLAAIGLQAVAYRLFLAANLESGLSPESLMKALAFEWAALDVERHNPDQPRVPTGSGRKSGQWTSANSGQIQTTQEAPLEVQVAQNVKCSDFIAQNCNGSVLRVLPGEYLDVTVAKF